MPSSRTADDSAPETLDRFSEVLERARGGDVAVLPELREILRGRPEIWGHCSDLAAIAERAWVDLAAGPDLAVAESLRLRLAELRGELAGPDPTPLERLAVDRVAISWLQSWYADAMAAGLVEVPPKVAAFALERQDRAQKRHLAALACLAMIRRLDPATASPGPGDGLPRRHRGASPGRSPNPAGSARPDSRTSALTVVRPDDQVGMARDGDSG